MIFIVLMIEAVGISETSVDVYQSTRRTNPEERYRHICHRENLTSHQLNIVPYSLQGALRCLKTRTSQRLNRISVLELTSGLLFVEDDFWVVAP
jgi:hypothetical protein